MKYEWKRIGFKSLGLVLACLLAAGCGTQTAASHPPENAAVATAGDVAAEAPAIPAADIPTPASEPAPAEAPQPQAEPAAQASDAPKPPQKQRLPADRQPRRPGDAEKITFEDLNLGMQPDIAYRPFMLTDRVKELEGQRVSIIGYMHEAQLSTNNVKEFVLLKNLQCKFGPGGQADHLTKVYLKEGTATKLSKQPIKVEGTLEIEPVDIDGVTWSLFNLKNATSETAK